MGRPRRHVTSGNAGQPVLGSGRCRHLVSERDHRAITASAGQAVWWHQRTAILCCPKGHRCRAKSRNRAGPLGCEELGHAPVRGRLSPNFVDRRSMMDPDARRGHNTVPRVRRLPCRGRDRLRAGCSTLNLHPRFASMRAGSAQITDSVPEAAQALQTRSLEEFYPVIYLLERWCEGPRWHPDPLDLSSRPYGDLCWRLLIVSGLFRRLGRKGSRLSVICRCSGSRIVGSGRVVRELAARMAGRARL
jgi:hypothetical protein